MNYTKELVLLFGMVQLGIPTFQDKNVFTVCCAFYTLLSVIEYFKLRVDQSKAMSALSIEQAVLKNKIKDNHNTVSASMIDKSEKLSTIFSRLNALEEAQERTQRLADESKKLISQANIGMGFRAVKREA
jgi:hypothetical protein